MSQTPRRLDKTWRREYDRKYREENQKRIQKQQAEYNARPENKSRQKRLARKWYEQHKKEVIEKHRQRDGTIEGKIRRWKEGARRRNIEWSLSKEFILSLPKVCYYTGNSLVMDVGHPNTISVDRVDSNKPYSPENVVLCCSMVNMMKSTFDRTEFIQMCKQIAAYEQSRH